MKKNPLFEKCLSNVAPEVWEKVRLKMDKDFVNEVLSYRAERLVDNHINKNQESYIMNENTKEKAAKAAESFKVSEQNRDVWMAGFVAGYYHAKCDSMKRNRKINKRRVRAWITRDNDESLYIYKYEPRQMTDLDMIKLPSDADERLIGKHIDWKDIPVEI